MLDEKHRFAGIDFLGELFNMTRDSGLFLKEPSDDALPLYEAKFIHQFDHRFAASVMGDVQELSLNDKSSPERQLAPKNWVDTAIVILRASRRNIGSRWLVGFRDIARATDERTSIASVLPFAAAGNSINLMLGLSAREAAIMMANPNAFAFDFCARQKISGSHVNIWIFKQLPAVPLKLYDRPCPWHFEMLGSWLLPRVLELSYTAWDLEAFAQDNGWYGPPFRWNEERRAHLRCELDAAFFHLYLPADQIGDWRPAEGETTEDLAQLKTNFPVPRDAVAYILDTFPIVRHRDEEKYDGDYLTKRVILAIYDAFQDAIRTGQPYRTHLDPPPGPPVDANGKFVDYAKIAANPPPHLHLLREHAGTNAERQLSDLARGFPSVPFIVRLGTRANSGRIRVTPVSTADLEVGESVLLAAPALRLRGAVIPAVIGKLGIESRSDASSGEHYVLVSVRGDAGVALARLSEAEWNSLRSVGRVENLS